ncbi:LacI family DNA-binding transcriptional regulator [Kineococcus gynurae]|uniref:LacI family DNA-binding transcriptional regulator n=1 Tax=Kineococcus gynurae TaxID=452979 RepID=A0ABV5LP65_9ACTN
MARVAGVAQSTVSYVMSGKRPISEKTRRLVQDAIDELTYQPNAGARALASHRTNIIALVVPFRSSVSAHGLMAFAEEIALASRAHDHDVLLVTADEGPEGLRRVAGRALCDALVVMEVATHDARTEVVRSLSLPTMFIGLPADAEDLHCIDFDFEAGAELLLRALHAGGNTEVHVLGWGADTEERDINYVPRVRRRVHDVAAELDLDLHWHVSPHGAAGATDFVAAVAAAAAARPPGLLLLHNLSAAETALRNAGWRPGVDVDVVALAPDADVEALEVPLTSVSTQPRDVSRQAMDWLFALLEHDAPGEQRRVPGVLTDRGTVRPRP